MVLDLLDAANKTDGEVKSIFMFKCENYLIAKLHRLVSGTINVYVYIIINNIEQSNPIQTLSVAEKKSLSPFFAV